jgi:hypothetical protein
MNTARRRRNQKIPLAPDNAPPRNPPSPPFDKGGLGGFQKGIAQRKFSSQNLKSLQVSSTVKKCLEFEMPKITYGILCLYIFIIGVICEICG